MIELSGKAVANGYSSSDTVGAGFTQGTSVLSLPPSARPSQAQAARVRILPGEGGVKPLFAWCSYLVPREFPIS